MHRATACRDAVKTLGDVLYAGPAAARVPEAEWVELVRAMAAGEARALLELYDRTHRAVFTLLVRLTADRDAAEKLAAEVYAAARQHASRYRASGGTVLGWMMNLARAAAIRHLRREQKKNRADAKPDRALMALDIPDYRRVVHFREQARILRDTLAGLPGEQREAIEATYFGALTYPEAAARLARPAAVVLSQIGEGLRSLADALAQSAEFSGGGPLVGECIRAEQAYAMALQALPRDELPAAQAHVSSCKQCRRDLDALRPLVASFVCWPTDLLRPVESLRQRVARLADLPEGAAAGRTWREPDWEEVAPGISCKLLANDAERHVVSMLVRLIPGGEYPAHIHSGVEELHLLDGELWIDERKLHPGDYNRADPGTGDQRVWSKTGCTCVLVTSTLDVLA
jgi:RNA polymerase sigma-70 factor (ECF subfamily)